MATTTLTRLQKPNPTSTMTMNKPPKSKLACFSFAAYSKSLMEHLKSSNIPVFEGLSDSEFTSVESIFGFSFPPDLRSILQEGLPVAPGFPNWRSSSTQQLRILLDLPSLGILKRVSQRSFWCESWGVDRPDDTDEALALAKEFLDKAPALVPIYRHFYLPSKPNMAGNPVFYVNGGDVRVFSFDVARLFQESEFLNISTRSGIKAPAWAAKKARRIEFWTDVAASGCTRWWRSGDLGGCLEEVSWRLRDGGWKEDEVMEMMMMMDGGDERKSVGMVRSKEGMASHMRMLSTVLLRAGWSKEDVVYSLDLQDDDHEKNDLLEGKTLTEFQALQHPNSCSKVEEDHQKQSLKQLMLLHSLKV
ncbi:uncharacterized protein LOC121261595 [Juglans microcarpa x Juglans regia]|uniref:uncharacterized protein LOC121261595 n=1 Tax=Juglans microcarpa x Juglans regia TaxID=2249226 RepID=UPI001B7E89D6|nr:uncharacterized protein LOC121261595 [Juglans microcarpa x Juglans regia]